MKQFQKQLSIALGLLISLSACATTGNATGNQIEQFGINNQQSVMLPSNIPTPQVSISDVNYIQTINIPTTTQADTVLDVSVLDDFIIDVTPNVRHYPPNFPSSTQRYNAKERIKQFVRELQPYADAPNASYEILMRSAMLNSMARNLDLGTTYAVNASKHVGRAVKMQPDSIEANLLYGIMLSEGGAFKTSRKYLDKAVELGSVEAEQTIAQSELMNDKRTNALQRLQRLQMNDPNNVQLAQQIAIVQEGGYRIWDLPAPNVSVKPVS